MSASEVLSNLAAGGGLFLGGLSFWISLWRTWERIKVIPLLTCELVPRTDYYFSEGPVSTLPIEYRDLILSKGDIGARIINMSEFDLEIESLGFTSDKKFSHGKSNCIRPTIKGKITVLPIRLQSRQAITVQLNAREYLSEIQQKKQYKFYARTACRKVFLADAQEFISFLSRKTS